MVNVCAVRTMRHIKTWEGSSLLTFEQPHEPVIFSIEDFDKMSTALTNSKVFDNHGLRIPEVGSLKLNHGLPVCRHCGCLYTAE